MILQKEKCNKNVNAKNDILKNVIAFLIWRCSLQKENG